MSQNVGIHPNEPQGRASLPAHLGKRRATPSTPLQSETCPPRMFLDPGSSTLNVVEPGQVVWVGISQDDEQYVLSAVVRWRGWNEVHTQVGFGVEFEPHCQVLVQGLSLSLDESGCLFIPADAEELPGFKKEMSNADAQI